MYYKPMGIFSKSLAQILAHLCCFAFNLGGGEEEVGEKFWGFLVGWRKASSGARAGGERKEVRKKRKKKKKMKTNNKQTIFKKNTTSFSNPLSFLISYLPRPLSISLLSKKHSSSWLKEGGCRPW